MEAGNWRLEIGVLALVGGLLFFFSLTVVCCTPASSPSPPVVIPSPTIVLSPTLTLSPSPSPFPSATPSPSPTPSPPPIPSPTPTATSSSTPTSTRSPTPSPSLTPTPSPTPTPVTPRILIVEHAEERAAGVANYLTRLGLPFDRLRVYAGDSLPPPERGQMVILSGGPMSPHDVDDYPFLRAEADFLRQALDLKVPILGICLGHQLLAHLLGGEVTVSEQEVGWLPVQLNEAGTKDILFDGILPEFFPFHYHTEQVVTLPPGATVLASSPLCPVQAFRYGQAPVWGVQFHPESILTGAGMRILGNFLSIAHQSR